MLSDIAMNAGSEKTSNSVLFIGATDSGKSNFLFRLVLAIDAGRGLVRKDGIPDDLDYLETGVRMLLSGEFAPHTPSGVQERTMVPIKWKIGTEEFKGNLIVPDCPGEEWVRIYERREWSEDWQQLITARCSCLLFVRVDSEEIVAPLDWLSCAKLHGCILPDPGQTNENEVDSRTPTQVLLVDWLQFLRTAFTDRVGGSYHPRIGVVVTAWDLVPAEQQLMDPKDYLRANFPLFRQFLDSNIDRFEFATFGVSVVGGDLNNQPRFRKKYLEGNPSTSGYVVHNLNGLVKKSSDVTIPVAWALRIGK